MYFLIIAIEILAAGAVGALLSGRRRRLACALGCGGAVVGCLIGLVGAIQLLRGGLDVESVTHSWPVPYGAFALQADALAGWFLLAVFGLGALAAMYGGEYLGLGRDKRPQGRAWFFYNLLVAAMALVLLARNVMLFLMAWEVMALASFFLVTLEDERESVQRAGWTYLTATHLGTAALFVMFALLARAAGSMDFENFSVAGALLQPRAAGLVFILALLGFGAKAGIVPLHVWLPEAHPAAPSHVSALMSGVMIKTGIYGIIRVLSWLPQQPPTWWAWTLIGVGAVSGVGGVLFALAQHDLKRLLAYSSVENIGIIFLGLGLGVLGMSQGSSLLTTLGFGGALLHVLNHALMKGTLFMGAGAVLHTLHTAEIDQAGGLLRRMPWTGACFLIGAAAICGLPPLGGFVGEFLLYFGAFSGFRAIPLWDAIASLLLIAALALIGGLALACFTKAFGMVFLGEPRSPQAAAAHEAGPAMRIAMIVPAAACIAVGLAAPAMVGLLAHPLGVVTGHVIEAAGAGTLSRALWAAAGVAAACWGFVALATGLTLLRSRLLAGREVGQAGTWDCGYARPTARMQYTGSSFVQPLSDLFAAVLRTRRRLTAPRGLFPGRASLATRTPDAISEYLFCPLFKGVEWTLSKLRRLQTGSVHLYILYIAVTLIVLLIWKLR